MTKNSSDSVGKNVKQEASENTMVDSGIEKPKGSMGETLRKAREKQKLSHAKVAKDLFLKERQIEALEEERFADLPQESFAKAFALKYADYLDLDIDCISQKFHSIYPDELRSKVTGDIESPIREMGTVYREDRRLFHFNPALLLGAIAVFTLAVFLMQTVTSAEEAQNAPKVVEEGIDSSEQRQGASLESEVGAAGSAVGIESDANTNKGR